uniref:Uncharacterized protein n=1 Tax=Candidatus Kentrum sp. FW TaxID=2126338 RepID=A0A450SK99_9GAMM|nr:MAG: hypothetical protein BECKFW1821B_GA0114236_101629 [Candidatus Kentron sp. FW]
MTIRPKFESETPHPRFDYPSRLARASGDAFIAAANRWKTGQGKNVPNPVVRPATPGIPHNINQTSTENPT